MHPGWALIILAGMTVLAGGQPVAASGSIWTVVPSPNPSTTSVSNDVLSGVSALSDSEVWAVGSFSCSGQNNVKHTLAEGWNGSAWTVVPSVDVGTRGSELLGVAALAANDVWAVGDVSTSATVNGDRTLIEHWNGTAWAVVPSPNPSVEGDNLTAVAAITTANVWAVGYFETNDQSTLLPLIEHWNGTTWSVATAGVGAAAGTILHGITAIAANDIWAVGEAGFGTNVEMHWNGTRWSVTSVSFASGGQESLAGVAAATSNAVWAVGSYAPSTFAELQTLALHWNGRAWTRIATPNVDQFFNLLFGVAAVRSDDVWAVGYAYTPNGLSFTTLTEHWDGTLWTIVPSPTIAASELRGVVATGPTTIWSVGSFDSFAKGNPGLRTLTVHTAQG
jgi:hypothetical protein